MDKTLWDLIPKRFAPYRKFVTSLVGAVVLLVLIALPQHTAAINGVVIVLTTLGVYVAPNESAGGESGD